MNQLARRLALALALALVAAPAATLASATSARACGSYEDYEESRVRQAASSFLTRADGGQVAPRIDRVNVNGDDASARVVFRPGNGSAAMTATLILRQEEGGWRVTGMSYPVPAGRERPLRALSRRPGALPSTRAAAARSRRGGSR